MLLSYVVCFRLYWMVQHCYRSLELCAHSPKIQAEQEDISLFVEKVVKEFCVTWLDEHIVMMIITKCHHKNIRIKVRDKLSIHDDVLHFCSGGGAKNDASDAL